MVEDDLDIGGRAIVECTWCDKPVTRDDVIEHLMESHKKLDLAVLISLWWFVDPEDTEEQSPRGME